MGEQLTPTDLADGSDAVVQQHSQTEALKIAKLIPTGTLDNKGDTSKKGNAVRGMVKGKKRDQKRNKFTAKDSDEPL
jgi:hypothetical protein